MRLNRNFNFISTLILVILALATYIYIMIDISNKNTKLEEINSTLNTTIDDQTKVIKELQGNIIDLNDRILQLEEANIQLQKENYLLKQELEEAIAKANVAESNSIDFKTYMPYTAITNTSSKQWALQQQAVTNEDGLRCINGIPLVAVGTGWGLSVGDTAIVTCDNGNSFKIIVGDIKADIDTDADNKTSVLTGCRCEFIVETNMLDSFVRLSGSIATLDRYSGYVVNIEKI